LLNVQARVLPLRAAHAQGASVAREGGQLGDPELVHEAPQARIVRALEFELDSPGGDDHGRGLARIRAQYHVVLLAVGTQRLDLPLWQVGAVGDPDYAVVQAVDGVPILYGLLVEAAVLPQRIVVPVGWRLSAVLDRSLDGMVGRGRVDFYPRSAGSRAKVALRQASFRRPASCW